MSYSAKKECPRCHRLARLNVYAINGGAHQRMCSGCANAQRGRGDRVQRHYSERRLEARQR